jgi:hypothetical protein
LDALEAETLYILSVLPNSVLKEEVLRNFIMFIWKKQKPESDFLFFQNSASSQVHNTCFGLFPFLKYMHQGSTSSFLAVCSGSPGGTAGALLSCCMVHTEDVSHLESQEMLSKKATEGRRRQHELCDYKTSLKCWRHTWQK